MVGMDINFYENNGNWGFYENEGDGTLLLRFILFDIRARRTTDGNELIVFNGGDLAIRMTVRNTIVPHLFCSVLAPRKLS